MRKVYLLFIFSLLWSCIPVRSQKNILLRNGIVKTEDNINDVYINKYNTTAKRTGGKSWVLLQFKNNPSLTDRKNLLDAGIELIQYIPKNIFIVSADRPFNAGILKNSGVTSLIELQPQQKISSRLLTIADSSIEVMVAFFQKVPTEIALNQLVQEGFIVTGKEFKQYNIVQVKLSARKLLSLAALPFIEYIEPLPPPATELNYNSRNASRANVLQSALPGQYHLTGEGVTVGVGEPSNLQAHIDFKDRLTGDYSGLLTNFNTYHATHVIGTVAAAGLVNELYTGFAPKAKIIPMTNTSTMNGGTVSINYNLGMVLSNNSYVNGGPCSREIYSMFQFIADKSANDFTYLQHVFGIGNDGQSTCAGYPFGFNTVLSNYQLADYSAKGPAGGGRIKPEIVASGSGIISTVPDNNYGPNSGTSMSSPAVTGGLALLYQRYRQLHNGSNPRSSLMKAIVCNTAKDLGNPGPDYSYGFGYMNLLRAVKIIDNTNYVVDSIKDQLQKTHTITVPAGTTQLKIMLCWTDPPASLLSSKTLINDLDLQVIDPNSSIILPYILDTLPVNVTKNAFRGEDHINNIEQVVINNPVPGTYTIKIVGNLVAQGPSQEYAVVYDKLQDDMELTFPRGGEALAPSEPLTIQWNAWEQNPSTFQLQYSDDGSSNWITINASIPANQRQYDIIVPVTATNSARMRLIRNADGMTSTSEPFVIMAVPAAFPTAVQCPEYISIQWNAIAGATDYQLMRIQNGEMIVVDSTTSTSYQYKNLSPDSIYWVAVRPRINQKYGRRSIAFSRKPDSGTCGGGISDNDLKTEALLYPLYGRKFTANSLGTSENIRVRIKNLDDQAVSNFSVGYSVNNGTWVNENVAVTIAPSNFADYIFTAPYDFSATGGYTLRLVVKKTGDNNTTNDTLTTVIRNLDNQPLNITTPLTENFELAEVKNYVKNFWGIRGIDRFDYKNNSVGASAVIANLALSDTSGKGFRLIHSVTGDHELVATFNLSNYDTAVNNVGLEFNYSKLLNPPGDLSTKVWIRGHDTEPWIELTNLDPIPGTVITGKLISMQFAKTLRLAHQNFSSSTQVKWMQLPSASNDFVFDDIRLYDASVDAELVSVDSFNIKNCNLASALPVRIIVSNHSNLPLINLPVRYRINGGAVQEAIIPLIARDATISFTFPTSANLSAPGYHTIEAWTALNADSYASNDRKSVTIRNQPAITVFPYLQNFENGDGSWYAEGINSSWELGTPASQNIKGAASGTKAWKTKLAGSYNNNENSFLYSPCFDVSALNHPTLSFSIALNIDSCSITCDAVGIQLSTNGKDWRNINTLGNRGFNWAGNLRSPNYNRWHVITGFLSDTLNVVQFRINMRSDFIIAYDGIAIDDIHIYDSATAIFDGITSSGLIEQNITGGNEWIDFKDNGKIVASIQPNGQALGATKVRSYYQSGTPNFHGQYHLQRNFAMQGSKPLTDSVGVRLYILDKETDPLLFAKNCPACFKPTNAYKFGLSQYNTSKVAEVNGTIADNMEGAWKFIPSSSIKTVPFQKGYYLEFKTKDLSELWLNSGGYDNNSFLPVNLLNFTAHSQINNEVMVGWTTASEINIQRFETEVAKGNTAYQQGIFTKQGETNSNGASASSQSYHFTDASANKQGVYYYRLKIIDQYGNYSYSKTQPVIFSNEYTWTITPNLSTGLFNLNYQVADGEELNMVIFNSTGSVVRKEQFRGNGFITQYPIDLRNTAYAGGLYLVKVQSKDQSKVFKIIKQ
jgi:hypothetical protein